MRKIFVLCGLPGSGKTTYAKSVEGALIYDIDKWTSEGKTIDTLFSLIPNDGGIYILDGLFLTHASYKKTLQYFKEDVVIYHYWVPDREVCLYNDKGRREIDSSITIKYAQLEVPDIEKLKKINQTISIIYHTVKRKDEEL